MKNLLLLLIFIFVLLGKTAAMPFSVKRIGVENGLSSNYVVGITQDKKGCMWFATESGLNRFDGNHITVYKKYSSGLSGNEMNAIFSDSTDNRVWIGTQRDGLSVFDTNTETFTTYKAGPGNHGLTTNDITDIKGSRDNLGIWITTYHCGINYYDKKEDKFVHYYLEKIKDIVGKKCYTSCDDGKGNLYIGHDGNGMSIVSIKSGQLKNYMHNPNDNTSIPGNTVLSIFIDSNNNVWVGTNQGLALFNPATETFISFKYNAANKNSLLSNIVRDIREMRNGELWICTNMGGISILDLKKSLFMSLENLNFRNIVPTNDSHGLSSPNARAVFQDKFDNIWIANYRGGVDFISYAQPFFNILPYYMENEGKSINRQVWGMVAIDNKVWITGEEDIISFINGKRDYSSNISSLYTIPNSHVNVAYKAKNNEIWLGTYMNGILIYNSETNKITRLKSEENLNVNCFYEDGKNMYIGADQGIYKYENGIIEVAQEFQSQLPDKMIHGILRDKEGKLWIATFGKGVSIFDTDNKLSWNFVTDNGFCSNAVNHMIIDSNKRIWVATREGIAVFQDSFRPDSYKVYKEDKGLLNSNVRAITEDKNHNIWISTNGGISRLDENRHVFYNYNNQDGVPLGDFMSKSVCITKDGTIYFGSQNGACYFKPEDVVKPRKVMTASITGFTTFLSIKESKKEEVDIPVSSGIIELPYNHNTFKISFNVLDYTQSPQVDFSYMLEGLENVWYNTQDEKQIIFRNLPHGTYVFKLRTRFRNQEWNDDVASIKIVINPPLWLTWYAKSIYLLVFIGCILAFLRFYKRKIYLESSLVMEKKKIINEQELNNERLRFYTNITHELRTPLTLILGPLEDLLSDKNLSAPHYNKINIIRDSATRLLNLINGILEFRKTETQNRKLTVEKGDISKLLMEIGIRYKELNQNKKVSYSVNIETDDTILFFDREMITTILNNFLSNAAKYTPEGEIKVILRSTEKNGLKYTEIAVSDTGHGISSESLPHIFERYYQGNSKYQIAGSGIGLALVKGLAELHQAIINVESEEEKGTTFTIQLLTDNSYPDAVHSTINNDEPYLQSDIDEEANEDMIKADSKPILLVVEDNNDIREYIRSSFCDEYEVLTAENGQEGLNIAETKIPNIIISDIMMPIMNGKDLCRKIKDDMRTSHIPVILLTAKDSIQDKEEGYDSGADSYITKPFSAKLLQSRIVNLLETRQKIACMLRSNNQPRQDEVIDKLNPLDSEFINKITAIIEENLDMEKMDIGFIADKMCMSHSTLYRKIKGLTDMSANEFIRKVKMRNGVRLLLKGDNNISEISYMIGFSSVAYFRQCFKEEYGVSPSEFIKRQMNASIK